MRFINNCLNCADYVGFVWTIMRMCPSYGQSEAGKSSVLIRDICDRALSVLVAGKQLSLLDNQHSHDRLMRVLTPGVTAVAHSMLSIFHRKACSRWLPNTKEIDINNMKSTWPTRSPMQGDPTRPIITGPYTGGEVGVVSHPPTGKQPRLVPPFLN